MRPNGSWCWRCGKTGIELTFPLWNCGAWSCDQVPTVPLLAVLTCRCDHSPMPLLSLRIAYITAPDGVSIELVYRK